MSEVRLLRAFHSRAADRIGASDILQVLQTLLRPAAEITIALQSHKLRGSVVFPGLYPLVRGATASGRGAHKSASD
jgi:hypothetical protein